MQVWCRVPKKYRKQRVQKHLSWEGFGPLEAGGCIYRTKTESATAAAMAEMHRNWQTLVAQLLPATLLGAVAFALALIITDPVGPGLDPDALSYMGAAESVAAHGIYQIPAAKWSSADSTAPLAHFPPGYSTVLALPVRLGMGYGLVFFTSDRGITPAAAAKLADEHG